MLDASTHARMRFVQVLLFPALLPNHYTHSRLLRYPVTHSTSTLNYPSLGAIGHICLHICHIGHITGGGFILVILGILVIFVIFVILYGG